MPRETKTAQRQRGIAVCERMHQRYPDVQSALNYTDPFSLVICVLLSAQTTDAAVNKVTPELFRRWPTPQAMAEASVEELGEVIRTIGFWRSKAKHCVEAAQLIVSEYGGEVPKTMEELTRLPGVGRKTANIVLNKAFDTVDGIAVDTHVFRIAKRLHLSTAKTPLEVEQDLLKLLPRETWRYVNEEWIHFGREICSAQRPLCSACPLTDLCPSVGQPARYFKGGSKTAR